MAFIVDEKLAKTTPCHGYKYDGEKFLWSEGAVGMLSDPQEKKFCTTVKIKGKKGEVPSELKTRWKFFKKSAKHCSEVADKKPGKDLPQFLGCMSREAEKHGVEI